VGAKFIRDDLPYFLELLAEVVGKTKYQSRTIHSSQASRLAAVLI
jgi:ubiquinol-cytochrome c reductase core subunit 2